MKLTRMKLTIQSNVKECQFIKEIRMEAQLRVIEIKIIGLRDNIKDQNQGLFYLTITIYKTLLQTAQTEKKNRRFPCSKLQQFRVIRDHLTQNA